MTTTHTQPAGCDLDSLTRYDHRGALMVPDQTGDYFLVPDVREAAARAAQAPTGLQDEQGLADEGLDYLLQYIPVPAARVAAQCKVAELRAAQAPQGDTRQGAAIALPVDLIHDFRDAIAVARHRAKHDGDTASKKRWIEVASRLDGYARSIATPAAPACTGCDPAEGFCRDCRETERKAAHTCTPADELDTGTQAISPPELPKFMPGFFSTMEECWDHAVLTGWRAAQGAGTAPVGADERTIVAMPEEMPDAVESAILPLMDCSSPEGVYIAIRAALAQGAGTAPALIPIPQVRPVSPENSSWEDVDQVTFDRLKANGTYETRTLYATHPAPVSTAPSKSPEFEGISAAPVSTAAAPELTVKLAEMRESNGNVTWDVLLVKAGDSLMNGHSVYADRIKGRAEYEADSLRHFLGQGPCPDMLAYDTDPPVAEVSTAAAPTCKPAQAAPEQGIYVAYGDDAAVELFAAAMKAKMQASRNKGRSGWHDPDDCPASRLQAMLFDHLKKGDPVDIANFAMMLWNRGESVAAPEAPATEQQGLLGYVTPGALGQIADMGTEFSTFRNIMVRNKPGQDAVEPIYSRAPAATTASALEEQPVAWMCKTGHGNGWREIPPSSEIAWAWTPLYRARMATSGSDICIHCNSKHPLHDLECPVTLAAIAPSRAADGQQGASRAALDGYLSADRMTDIARMCGLDATRLSTAHDFGRSCYAIGRGDAVREYIESGAAIARAPLPAQAVASVVSRSGNDLRIAWLRPEQCDVGTLLYCAQSDTTGDH